MIVRSYLCPGPERESARAWRPWKTVRDRAVVASPLPRHSRYHLGCYNSQRVLIHRSSAVVLLVSSLSPKDMYRGHLLEPRLRASGVRLSGSSVLLTGLGAVRESRRMSRELGKKQANQRTHHGPHRKNATASLLGEAWTGGLYRGLPASLPAPDRVQTSPVPVADTPICPKPA